MSANGNKQKLTIERRPRVWGVLIASGVMMTLAMGTAAAQSTQPGGSGNAPAAGNGSSLLNRTKTKLKPAAAQKSTKPTAGLKTTGRKKDYPDPVLKTPDRVLARRDGSQVLFDLRSKDAQAVSKPNVEFNRGIYELQGDARTARLPDSQEDVEFGPILRRTPPVAPDPHQNLLEAARNGKLPHTNEEIRKLSQPEDLDTARIAQLRREYKEKGYSEVKLDNDYLAFVKARDCVALAKGTNILRDRYGFVSNPDDVRRAVDSRWAVIGDDLYRADSMNRIYPGDWNPAYGSNDTASTLRSCSGGRCGVRPLSRSFGQLDPFVTGKEAPSTDEALSLRDKAWEAIWEGDDAQGLAAFEQHLAAETEDREVSREYALALLHTGKLSDGIAKMYAVYRMNPTLATTPLNAELLPGGEEAMRDLAQRVVTLANASKGPEASVAAAVIFQSLEKNDAARRMLDRAKAKGMDERIGTEFGVALVAAK